MKLLCLTPKNRDIYLSQILDLERSVEYPYGKDFFKIDHGKDYFAFFDRLGKLYYYVLLDNDRVAGVLATVLRDLPQLNFKKIWYYCDLKIHPDYRGRHLPIKMLYKIYFRNFLTCWNGFCISMNPASGSQQNRMKKISRWLRWLPFKTDTQLSLFSFDQGAMQKAKSILEKYRGELGFLSLDGIKDLILTHNQSKIPVLHAQFGNAVKPPTHQLDPQANHIHMFCALTQEPLVQELAKEELFPSSTITLFNYGKKVRHWDWVLTSDL